MRVRRLSHALTRRVQVIKRAMKKWRLRFDRKGRTSVVEILHAVAERLSVPWRHWRGSRFRATSKRDHRALMAYVLASATRFPDLPRFIFAGKIHYLGRQFWMKIH